MTNSNVVDFNRARSLKLNQDIIRGLQEIELLNCQIRHLYLRIHVELAKIKAHSEHLPTLNSGEQAGNKMNDGS